MGQIKRKAVAAGHICIDMTPLIEKKNITNAGEVFVPGSVLQVGAMDIHTGGSVANTGLAMQILGVDTLLIGKVGDDELGRNIAGRLSEYNAEKGLLIDGSSSTSYSVVLAVPGRDRMFLHNPGANDTFCCKDIPYERLNGIDLFHFGYPPIMKQMYQNEGIELETIFRKAKEAGAITSLDMAAIDEDSQAGSQNWKLILKRVLPYVDLFLPSIDELCFMVDRRRLERWKSEKPNWAKEAEELAEITHSLGCKNIMIKCGASGMYYETSGDSLKKLLEAKKINNSDSWSEQKGFERSYKPEQIVSATGAGDTAIAALLTAMLNGYELKTAVKLAAATGASCVEYVDALSGLKPFDELLKKIEGGWEKQ